MIKDYECFDFSVVDNIEFKEDSVRELLVLPLLNELGYEPYGDYSVERSSRLTHPYVYFGTQKRKVSIVPDYVLKVKNKRVCIIDAKAPKENILNGKNVEQAYSYAIHPDVRAKFYVLFNGKYLSVFHVDQIDPILYIPVKDINSKWSLVEEILAPYNIGSFSPIPLSLYPDFGVHILKCGFDKDTIYYSPNVPINMIHRVNDFTFSLMVNQIFDGKEYATTFDFDMEMLEKILNLLQGNIADNIIDDLMKQPYLAKLNPPILFNMQSELGFPIDTKYETIVPFIIRDLWLA
ncbi:type I restriction enzyme HsdR N-terminal domain-containing protein [Vibrio metoecus]|uniref:type I restriction enzyme HsdR N-terminal domain-containing protein n=1 Tax=Vibrio metoecus TaxID=1481663 RepID=UPI0013026FF1|nr:type I restriction enzyme HsdR N-terminal domain-containing protein [Vibrio metoecus]